MKPAGRLSLAAACVTAMAPCSSRAAPADAIRESYSDRVEHAERVFGDVRFVMGSGQAMEWLEMYVGTNLVAAFRDFDAQEVSASPDGRYFLAISNTTQSSLAFAVLDRKGHVLFSRAHNTGNLHYCKPPTMKARYWINPDAAAVRFELAPISGASPARDYLKSVTVQACDGKELLLGQAGAPDEQIRNPALTPAGMRITPPAGGDSNSVFIGNAIANLRGLDPTFGGRTLTMVDGRRMVGEIPAPLPAALASAIAAAVGPQGSRQTTITAILPGTLGMQRVIERRWCERDGSLCGADLFTARDDDSVQLLARDLLGEFIVLPAAQRVFSCENTLRETRAPVLIDANGGRITLPASPGGLNVCMRAGSSNEVQLVYRMTKAGRPFHLVRIFDGSGALLAESGLDQAGTVRYTVADRKYEVRVSAP